jgi:hypothetical protein
VSVACASGQKAIGGGWCAGLYAAPIAEGPTADGSGWTVTFESATSTAASVSVAAICAAP